MKKRYKFSYDFQKASATFEVDEKVFTPEMAKSTLTFFMWDYDEDGDPVDEVMNKYALEAIRMATFNNHNTKGVISDFNSKEGFALIDGSLGITLTTVEGFEFTDDDLIVDINAVQPETQN